MTAEEFLEYVDEAKYYRDKGKSRLNRARRNYSTYREAYAEKSLRKLVYLAVLNRNNFMAIARAAEDRDAGRPMAVVEEFMPVAGGGHEP